MARLLVLVRHAKTQPATAGDRDRELTDRGHRQAAALGPTLAEVVSGPVLGLVSAAVRARQTWDGLAASVCEADVEDLESLYVAGPEDILDAVRVVPDATGTVVVVGHNPAIADLAWSLAGEQPGKAFDDLRSGGYSPATATVFDVAGEWAELDGGAVTLTAYVPPL